MRGFVFSLDAFVAFMLALVAVYSLIFFSSIPSSYYYLLTQGHFLARDVLFATSTTECNESYSCGAISGSILDAIVSLESSSLREALIRESVGEIVPNQFGYILEISSDQGKTWRAVYDTSAYPDDQHAKSVNKMKVSSQVVNFGYTGTYQKAGGSPFKYITCPPVGSGSDGLVITCGNYSLIDPDAAGEIVPLPRTSLVRLTIFI
ncbi:hypothetical protein H0O02_00800 [Candidatus Micrarchaeota archaeon]|nr:hypothetical protein [Candidatus Micrarchaeota archaeon]